VTGNIKRSANNAASKKTRAAKKEKREPPIPKEIRWALYKCPALKKNSKKVKKRNNNPKKVKMGYFHAPNKKSSRWAKKIIKRKKP